MCTCVCAALEMQNYQDPNTARVCMCTRVCARVAHIHDCLFSRFDSECLARMIRLGATRVALRTQRDYGGYGVYSILRPPTLRLISGTLPSHTPP